MKSVVAAILFCILAHGALSVSAQCITYASWDNSTTYSTNSGTYSLKWRVFSGTIDLFISFQSQLFQPGWVGFGISEVGHMLGSDVVTMTSNFLVEDRYVPWTAAPFEQYNMMPYPAVDVRNDWSLRCSYLDSSTLTAVVRRALNTSDPQDRPITAGPLPIIYAAGSNSIGYHGSNRGSTYLTFFGQTDAYSPPSDANGSIEGNFNPGWALTTQGTQYICQAFDMGTTDLHVVAIEPTYLKTPGEPYVHHVLVHACGNNLNYLKTYLNVDTARPFPCSGSSINSAGNSPLAICPMLIYANAKGGSALRIPDEAGFKLSATGNRYIIVEVHVNNPSATTGINITNIVRLKTTSTLRRSNAATMIVGDSLVSFPNIASGSTNVHYEATCTPACTSQFPGTVNVFRSFLHMHLYGKSMWSTKYIRNSTGAIVSQTLLDTREFWNFGYQTDKYVNFTLTAGDQISTHCVYDTSRSSSAVTFGQESTNEMCMHFLMYYPAENGRKYCGYNVGKTLCGDSANRGSENNPLPDGVVSLPLTPFGTAPAPSPGPANAGWSVVPALPLICVLAALGHGVLSLL